jgi:hypothetical protein
VKEEEEREQAEVIGSESEKRKRKRGLPNFGGRSRRQKFITTRTLETYVLS